MPAKLHGLFFFFSRWAICRSHATWTPAASLYDARPWATNGRKKGVQGSGHNGGNGHVTDAGYVSHAVSGSPCTETPEDEYGVYSPRQKRGASSEHGGESAKGCVMTQSYCQKPEPDDSDLGTMRSGVASTTFTPESNLIHP
ncbi:hypothetical protein ACU8KH_02395 [Lachancea thermotolerans]